jgi:phosphatidate phosphatase APP1
VESKIIGYRGIANKDRVIISGHAFEKHKVRDLNPLHGRRRNLKQTISRFRARPLKWTEVILKLNGEIKKVRTNKHGFFTCEVKHQLTEPGWYPYELFWKRNHKVFKSEFCLSDEQETGVISDIDDTLLVSHSTRIIRKMVLMLFRNAHTRKAIPMLNNWYTQLRNLHDSETPRDFFYVSNSEWNLYDFLNDFFNINELPKGVFFLQSLKKGLRDVLKTGKVNNHHKLNSIEFLMKFYPEKKFILVGDNGQKDMDIYSDISSRYSTRIKGVLIRELPYIKNARRTNRYRESISQFGIPFITFR